MRALGTFVGDVIIQAQIDETQCGNLYCNKSSGNFRVNWPDTLYDCVERVQPEEIFGTKREILKARNARVGQDGDRVVRIFRGACANQASLSVRARANRFQLETDECCCDRSHLPAHQRWGCCSLQSEERHLEFHWPLALRCTDHA